MTDSQLRLERNLLKLNGGRTAQRLWELKEIKNLLVDELKTANSSQLVLQGEFENRSVGDILVSSGFRVTINPVIPNITIYW